MIAIRGNFVRETSLGLKGFVLNPWVKKNSSILNSKGDKDYCSAVPVRYIPKESCKSEELALTSQPIKELTVKGLAFNALRSEFLNGETEKNIRKSFSLDGKSEDPKPGVKEEIGHNFEVECSESEELDMPEENNNSRKLKIQATKTREDVELMAAKFLSKRALTAIQLKKKLVGKRCPHELVDSIIKDYQSRGFINDSMYAETYSRSRWSSSTWGPNRIKQSLFGKGVSKSDTEKALQVVFDNNDEDQESSKIGMSKQSLDHLYSQASKQWMRNPDIPIDKRKSRMANWLQYRGFNWKIISYIIKKLESNINQ